MCARAHMCTCVCSCAPACVTVCVEEGGGGPHFKSALNIHGKV